MRPVLYTFAVSHFSEKARWALDFTGIDYKEELLAPGPHIITIRPKAEKSSVPVLESIGGVCQGSGLIIDYAERMSAQGRLQINGEVDDKLSEARLDRNLGRSLQTLAYSILLKHSDVVQKLFTYRQPFWYGLMLKGGFFVIEQSLQNMYSINPQGVKQAEKRFNETIDLLDEIYEKTHFIDNHRFCRLDLTVASLLSPLVMPPEHPYAELWSGIDIPVDFQAFREKYINRPVFKRVEKFYSEYRLS